MRKFAFGCVLMVCGMLGGTGWLLAAVHLVQPGGWSTLASIWTSGSIDAYVITVFYLISIVGAVFAATHMKKVR